MIYRIMISLEDWDFWLDLPEQSEILSFRGLSYGRELMILEHEPTSPIKRTFKLVKDLCRVNGVYLCTSNSIHLFEVHV